ncbi:MAG: efflux RND transporter periplasmic adaptor subunit [Burkholderiales bacterium]
MRSVSVLLVTLALLAACSRPASAPEPIRAVRTITVQDQSASARLEYAAEVRARTESRLSFRVGGKLIKRQVDLGDAVKAGQVLAQLDSQDLKLAQDSARAQMAAAQANVDLAAADFKRFKDLREQNFISAAELERRETTLKAALAQLNQSRAQTQVQTNQAGYAVLVSDVAGVVTGVDAEPGAVVSPASPVLRVAQNEPRDVVFAVPEDRVSQIRTLAASPSNAFRARAWGDDKPWWTLKVREVAASADPLTRTFLVKADLSASASAQVNLGQTMSVVVDLPPVAGITKLPLSALREDQGQTKVWLVDAANMTVQLQAVALAGADGNQAVIAQGLKTGDVVVTAGVHALVPGQKVKWLQEANKTAADPGEVKPAK